MWGCSCAVDPKRSSRTPNRVHRGARSMPASPALPSPHHAQEELTCSTQPCSGIQHRRWCRSSHQLCLLSVHRSTLFGTFVPPLAACGAVRTAFERLHSHDGSQSGCHSPYSWERLSPQFLSSANAHRRLQSPRRDRAPLGKMMLHRAQSDLIIHVVMQGHQCGRHSILQGVFGIWGLPWGKGALVPFPQSKPRLPQ